MEGFSWRFKKYVIDRTIPFPTILSAAGIEVEYGACYCPFHDNTNTPAARLYGNGDKGDTLYCWAEQRVYTPSDVLTSKLLNQKLDAVFDKLWRRLPEISKKSLIQSFDEPTTDISDVEVQHLKEKLADFKLGLWIISILSITIIIILLLILLIRIKKKRK